jgi:hypothetical protein
MKTCIPVPPLQTHVARENTCHFLTPLSPFFPNSCSTAPPQLQWLDSTYQKESPHFSLRVPTSAYVGIFLFIWSIPSRWLLTRTNNLPRSLGRQVIIKLFLFFLHKLTTRWSDEWWTHFSALKQSNDLTYRVSSPQLPMLSPLLPLGSELQETERAGCIPQQPSPIYWDYKGQVFTIFLPWGHYCHFYTLQCLPQGLFIMTIMVIQVLGMLRSTNILNSEHILYRSSYHLMTYTCTPYIPQMYRLITLVQHFTNNSQTKISLPTTLIAIAFSKD